MKKFYTVLSGLIVLLIPLAAIGSGARLLLTPLFPNMEYRLPDFPPDDYGFSTQDRLHWGMYGINYLINTAGISYLAELRVGDGTPLFTDPELSHMQDVKRVTQGFLRAWVLDLLILTLLGIWAWRRHWLPIYRVGLVRGGWLTLGLALVGGVIATFGASGSGDLFWTFFSDFHGLFFQGNSWLFAYSDSLIRLYPLKFWQDAVLYIGIISAVIAIVLAFGLKNANHVKAPPRADDV